MIDVLALVSAVAGLEGVVKASVGLVDTIRGKWGSGDDEVKAKLRADIDAMAAAVSSVAQLAESGQAYVEVRDEVHRLQLDLAMLERYLLANADVLRNHLAPGYETSWLTVEQLLGSMERNRESSRRVHLSRQQFIDVADHETISSRLADASAAYEQCSAFVKVREPDRLRERLDDMQRPLALTDTLLKDTLTTKILGGIAAVRSDREP
jgi:hypothetical protein